MAQTFLFGGSHTGVAVKGRSSALLSLRRLPDIQVEKLNGKQDTRKSLELREEVRARPTESLLFDDI